MSDTVPGWSALAASPGVAARTGSSHALPPPAGDFDYIVVGGGSAGCAVAGRLAQLTDARILLLEAGGGDDVAELRSPQRWADALATRACRTYRTEPQPGTAGRVHDWPRGRVIGGSSAVNALIYARGDRSDFDAWGAAGCTGWDHASVLPDFRALEDFDGGADAWRGSGGPQAVARARPGMRHPAALAFEAAALSLGLPANPDINGERLEGVGWADFTIRHGRRHTAAEAFLGPALARPNLTVLTDAPALGLAIERGRCHGVRYLHGGRPAEVRASAEVIVACGAVESPRLLMLSGIGPAAELRALGLPVAVEAPEVGRNLQDHLFVAGLVFRAPAPLPESCYNRSEIYVWWRSRPELAGPDILIHHHVRPFALAQTGIAFEEGHTVLPGLARPRSMGSIRLTSADPAAELRIDPAYLSDEADMATLLAAAELCRAIAAEPAFRAMGAEAHPGPQVRGPQALRRFIAEAVHTFFHPTSTCRMGVDAGAVVDPELRVRGIDGLRVADASVMPCITAANTNAPSLLIGWRCAALLAGGAGRTQA